MPECSEGSSFGSDRVDGDGWEGFGGLKQGDGLMRRGWRALDPLFFQLGGPSRDVRHLGVISRSGDVG